MRMARFLPTMIKEMKCDEMMMMVMMLTMMNGHDNHEVRYDLNLAPVSGASDLL